MSDCPIDQPSPALVTREARGGGAFAMTRWSMILAAARTNPGGASSSMEQLCRIYWYPIYAFIRHRRGYQHHDAEDLTQGFFAHLLEHETLKRAAGENGRFRTFLLAVLSKFLANEKDAREALKRGGRHKILSLDAVMAENLFACEPVEHPPDDRDFDRGWCWRSSGTSSAGCARNTPGMARPACSPNWNPASPSQHPRPLCHLCP